MSVTQSQTAQNATYGKRMASVGITSVLFTSGQKAAKVNVSADLTRSQSLQNFTTFASTGACGDKEQ
jgi:hypothetical protein